MLEKENQGFHLQLGEQWSSILSWGINQPFPIILAAEEFIPRMAASLIAEDTLEGLYLYEQHGPAAGGLTSKTVGIKT